MSSVQRFAHVSNRPESVIPVIGRGLFDFHYENSNWVKRVGDVALRHDFGRAATVEARRSRKQHELGG